jgi:hypothetical protein
VVNALAREKQKRLAAATSFLIGAILLIAALYVFLRDGYFVVRANNFKAILVEVKHQSVPKGRGSVPALFLLSRLSHRQKPLEFHLRHLIKTLFTLSEPRCASYVIPPCKNVSKIDSSKNGEILCWRSRYRSSFSLFLYSTGALYEGNKDTKENESKSQIQIQIANRGQAFDSSIRLPCKLLLIANQLALPHH